MDYKITFDKNKCEENRVCEAKCPKYWVFDSAKGKIQLKGAKETKTGVFELVIPEKDYKCNLEAVKGCPKNAIKIEAIKKK